jgi:hypothetical protein
MLPFPEGGPITHTTGWFELDAASLSSWLRAAVDGRGPVPAGWMCRADAVAALTGPAGAPLRRRAVVPVGERWSVLLTDGPTGTDVGLLPSHAARELGVRALRAVCAGDPHPARVLELFGPGGAPPLLVVRSIVAADDGGRWVFETSGEPLAFERPGAHRRRRRADRFPASALFDYLGALGVPYDREPDWPAAVVVET